MANFVLKGEVIAPSENLSWRDVKGELVALNTASGEYYSFNEVGREVWLAIAAGTQFEELVDRIVAEYDVRDRETAMRDVEKFVLDLKSSKLVNVHQTT